MLSAAHPRQLIQYRGIALRAGILTVLLVITLAVVAGKDAFSFLSIDGQISNPATLVSTGSNATEVGSFRFAEANAWEYRTNERPDRLTNFLFAENNAWDHLPVLIAFPDVIFTELNSWDHPLRTERIDTDGMLFAEDNNWDHTNQPLHSTYGIQNN